VGISSGFEFFEFLCLHLYMDRHTCTHIQGEVTLNSSVLFSLTHTCSIQTRAHERSHIKICFLRTHAHACICCGCPHTCIQLAISRFLIIFMHTTDHFEFFNDFPVYTCMCVYIYIYIYNVYMYIYIHIIHIHIHIYTNVHAYISRQRTM
jgi:hypothetical protein